VEIEVRSVLPGTAEHQFGLEQRSGAGYSSGFKKFSAFHGRVLYKRGSWAITEQPINKKPHYPVWQCGYLEVAGLPVPIL
jgi:hypothetical protein